MKRYIRSSQKLKTLNIHKVITASTTYTDHWTYTRNNQKFHVKAKYIDEPEYFQCQISEIHPYDLAEYVWVKKDSPVDATFYQKGKNIGSISVPEWDEDDYEDATEYVNEVVDMLCVELRHMNKQIEPRIDRT